MMKIKYVAAAVALAISGGASAAILAPTTAGGGELFVSVWDQDGTQSYHMDLGMTVSNFLANPAQSLSYNLAADANYSNIMSATGNVYYSVTAGDISFADVNTYGLLLTSSEGASAVSGAFPNEAGFISPGATRIADHALNLNADAGDNANGAANNSALSLVTDQGYYNKAGWGHNLGGFGVTVDGLLGDSLSFYHVGLSQVDYSSSVLSEMANVWNLDATGSLTYAAASTVPVPAAVWLFGSGLLGLVGVARRKKQA
jgi:hypothetical protein